MKKSNELKQERANKLNAQKTLLEARKSSDSKEFSEEQRTQFNNLTSEIEDLDERIDQAEAEERQAARIAKMNGKQVEAPAVVESTKNKRFSLVRSLRTLAAGKELTGIDAEINERGVAEMQDQGMEVQDGLRLHLPADVATRGQSISDDSGTKGGALVASQPQLVAALMPNIDVLRNLGVNEMGGLVGDVPLPSSSLFNFNFVGETADVTETDVTFSGPTLKPKRCAGVGAVSNKFLRQDSVNAEAYLINIMNNANGAAIIKNVVNGAGGNAPTGLYDIITTNVEATTGAPTKAIITELESLVDAANGTSAARGYLSDTKLANKLKNTKVDAGSGVFLYDGGELNGYNYQRSTLVDTLDLGASHPLIFGDWSQLAVGYWGNMSIMIDPYTLASSGKVRIIVESFSDSNVSNEKAFAINKVLTV